MSNAGIIFRSRNSRIEKQNNRRLNQDKETNDSSALPQNVQNQIPLNSNPLSSMVSTPPTANEWSTDAWLAPSTEFSALQPESAQAIFDVSNIIPAPSADALSAHSESIIPSNFKSTQDVHPSSGSATTVNLPDMSLLNEALVNTHLPDFNAFGSHKMQLDDTMPYSDARQDLSLLTKPISLQEQAPSNDSGSLNNLLGYFEPPNFDETKFSVQEILTSSLVTDLSTRKMLEFCTAHDMGKVTPLPPRITTIAPPTQAELGDVDDILCLCVLDNSGNVVYRLKKDYYSSLQKLYNDPTQMLELPGGIHVPMQTGKDDLLELKNLFPSHDRFWHDSDYFRLKCEASTLLQNPAALTLIRTALKDLEQSLPFFQAFEIEEYVSQLIPLQSMCTWTPIQVRQRTSLLLLLSALGSSLTMSVCLSLDSQGKIGTALPWEFGYRCYQLARGLLCPAQKALAPTEMTMEMLQCLILINMYMNRCGDRNGSWLPLTYGNFVVKHILKMLKLHQEESLPTQSMLQWEMLKRCICIFFMLEVISRINGYMILPQCIWTCSPLSMEMPVYLHGIFSPHGRVDDVFSSHTFSRFIFHIELCQIFVRIVQLKLDDTIDLKQNLAKVASVRDQLTQWMMHSPCLQRSMGGSQLHSGKWTGSEALDGTSVFLACTYLLNQASR